MNTTGTTNNLSICYILRHIPVPSETFVINEILALQSLSVDIYPVSLLPAQKCHEQLMALLDHDVLELADDTTLRKGRCSSFYSASQEIAESYLIPEALAAQAAIAAEYVIATGCRGVHAHFATESAWVALLVSKITGIPFTFTAHAYDIFMDNSMGEGSPSRRLNLLLGNASRAFTVSRFNEEQILSKTEGLFASKIQIIHCGIDPDRFKPVVKSSSGSITFLSVGRFVEKKGYPYLLQSFRKAVDAGVYGELRIIGEGPIQPAITQLAEELGVDSKVRFLGSLSSEMVQRELAGADIFVLHSVTGTDGDKEGIPVAIMEASSAGLPVVSTKHSGIPELVIDGKSGFLSEEKDIDGFAKNMITLAESPDLRERMGLAGRANVCDIFNVYKQADELKEAFQSLTDTGRLLAEKASVDIIMATYRPDEALLSKAIQSIVNQTYQSWQLYLVQDGDECDLQGLIKQFDDPRIHAFTLPHQGKPAALNFGVTKGAGKYIAYLDDDDIWYSNHLTEVVSFMARNDIKFVHSDGHETYVTRDGDSLVPVFRRSLNKGAITDKTLWYISHINVVHERQLLRWAGVYDQTRAFFIDWDMWIRLAKLSKPFHLSVVTCEHYIYLDENKQLKNTISSSHAKDPVLSERMHRQMFQRSFDLLTSDDFVEIVKDWQVKYQTLEIRDKAMAELSQLLSERDRQLVERDRQLVERDRQLVERDRQLVERDRKIDALLASWSWKISSPLRWIVNLVSRK